MTLRQLSPHRVVVHHDHAGVFAWRFFEQLPRFVELMLVDVTDDGDVAQVPCQRATRDTVGGIDPDECRAGHVQYRLQIPVDEFAVILVYTGLMTEAEWRFPPGDVMVARNGDDAAHFLCVPDERCCALKFPGASALGEITGYDNDVELPFVDDLLDCLDLLGHGR